MERANQPPDSYRLGDVAWNQMDLSAEEAAFDLESGEISSPVRSSRGWHIFRLNNKEETFFADATTFDNARESLGFALERRQYEEIAPMYVDSVTAEIELVTQVGNLRELWNDLAPRLPNRRGELVAMLQREAAGQRVGDLPRSTPLAQVDGQAFTVGQFMKRLPNIPASQLGPDLRIALESAIKDSIFAARARLDGYMDHTDVIKDRRIASTEAYYRAYVNVVADTLQLEPIAEKWYSNWKERYAAFGDINMEVVAFSDSMEAQQALSRYLESRLTADLLSASDNKRSIVIDTVNTSADDLSPAHPALSLPDEQIGAADQPWWGPFKQHDSWTFIRVMSREVRYRDYEDVKVEHLEQMKRRFPEIVHQEILENLGYDPSEIDYNTGLIRESLPIYY